MICRIWSDLPSFKTLDFEPGLNVLLADKSEGATDRQSRNGAGKTSLIEIIHFLFGADAGRESIFRSESLEAATFAAVVDIGDSRFQVARSGKKPNDIRLTGDPSIFSVQPKLDKTTGDLVFSRKEWSSVLGTAMFGLPTEDGANEDKARFAPTFRSLFSYFVRRQSGGGFAAPERHYEQQLPWDQQVNISYLLGLDASIPGRFQVLRQREKVMAELRRAAKAGDLGGFFGTAADMRTRLIVIENKMVRLKDQVARFHVVPEYDDLEKEATHLTKEIGGLSNANTQDRFLIAQLEAALSQEQPPAVGDLQTLYSEAGVLLPSVVARRFEEVALFHQAVVENRRAHLSAEIESAQDRVQSRNEEKVRLDARRRQVMEILRGGGALDHYLKLQEEAGRVEAEAETLRRRLELAEQLESTKAELDIERAKLLKSLQADHRERDAVIREAVVLFEELSEALYERAGSLTINPGKSGPEFAVRIDSSRSKGINNMQIFCFDLMLAELNVRRGRGPGFLVHDSHLFDGVDERQVAKALQLGADRAKNAGFQYIVTMNSDAVPKEGFRDGFELDRFILPVRLTDASEDGGIFGVRFN
jgi:uncharacterized protein YydD (DUF2326 family)